MFKKENEILRGKSRRGQLRLIRRAGFATALISTFLLSPALAHAQDYLLYAGTTTGDILAINPLTGSVSVVANSGIGNMNGVAWDAANERLYFSRTTTTPGDGGLRYWDRRSNTISALLLDSVPLPGYADSASIYNGKYWYINGTPGADGFTNDTMFSIDLSTLAVTQYAGPTGFDGTARNFYDFGDIAIDSHGMLYGSANITNGTGSNVGTFFSSSVPATGVTGTGYSQSALNTIPVQLGMAPNDGTLYGVRPDGTWYTINKTTGEQTPYTFLNTAGWNIQDLSSGALMPTPAPPGIVSGLIGIVMAGSHFGMLRVRKRRKAKKEMQVKTVTIRDLSA